MSKSAPGVPPHRYRGLPEVSPRNIGRALAVGAVVIATMMANPAAASAHALLVSSSPVDGADLSTAPPSITLSFDEQVLPESARLTLYSGQGTVLGRSGSGSGTGTMALVGTAGVTPTSTLVMSMPPLGQGAFALDWQVQSADDLHVTSGSIVFGVGLAVNRSAVDRTGPLPPAGSSLVRWSDLLALALMLGSLLLCVLALPRASLVDAERARWMRACGRVFHAMAGAAIVTSAGVLLDAAGDLGHAGQILTSTAFGRFWSVHLAGLICVFLLSRNPRRRMSRAVIMVGLLAAVTGLAAGSHVGTGADRPAAATLLGLHLAVGCGWAGSVVLLAVAAFHVSFRRQLPLVLQAYAAPAAACVALVAITGIALGARQVASADALITSTYGRILLVKVALTATAAALGLRSYLQFRGFRRPGPRSAPDDIPDDRVIGTVVRRQFARRVAVDALTFVLILGSAASLSLGSPPRGPAFAPAQKNGQNQIVGQVDGLLLTLDLSPNTVGENWARVAIDDTRRPARAWITDVTLAMTSPSGRVVTARALSRIDSSNRWQLGSIPVTESGQWQLDLTVLRPGLAPTSWHRNWITAAPPAVAVPPILSDRPWGRTLDLLALLLTVCCIGGVVGRARIGQRRRIARSTDAQPICP